MYNRYIPKEDGSYTRNRMPEPQTQHQVPRPAPPQEQPSPPPERHGPPPVSKAEQSPLSFIKRLLPKGFDTGDLFIVLLLLLMAGDCEEDRNNALLTLALYFLM